MNNDCLAASIQKHFRETPGSVIYPHDINADEISSMRDRLLEAVEEHYLEVQMNDDDNALVDRAIKAAEPFKVAHIAMDVLNLKRLLSTELHEEARHDLRLIASMGQQWQPIETAPKDGRRIRLWNGQEHVGWWWSTPYMPGVNQLMGWTDGTYDDRYFGPNRFSDVTHWQPCSSGPGKETV